MFIILYAVPQILLGYCYTNIALAIRSNRKCNGRMTRVAMVTMKIRCRIVKMTFAVSLAFAVCWLPMHIAAIMSAVGVFSYYFQLFVPCFAYTTVSLNPIIYCFMSKTFRKSLKATFTCNKLPFNRSLLGDDADLIEQNRTPSSSNSNRSDCRELCTAKETEVFSRSVGDGETNIVESSRSSSSYDPLGELIDKECQTDPALVGAVSIMKCDFQCSN